LRMTDSIMFDAVCAIYHYRTMDAVLLVFVLSAMPPDRHAYVLLQVSMTTELHIDVVNSSGSTR
jgi:hypothetical protein